MYDVDLLGGVGDGGVVILLSTRGALNVTGGVPGGEDCGVFLINATEDGLEGLDGGGAAAYGFWDGGGGSSAFA